MPIQEGDRYNSRACPDCGELSQHGRSCDNPKCGNYCGPLVRVVLQVAYVEPRGTLPP